MGLLNRKGVPLRQRLRTSWWTSAGICAFLLVGHARLSWMSEDVAEAEQQTGSSSPEAQLRRLRVRGGSNIEDKYPPDLVLTKPYREDPHRWLVILHVIGIGYMLLGLNTVCDVYFTGALEEMVENWNVQDDVAGATFMAAGGSAPEFFTALIGTTIVENDVGFGTIVGSAVFNVLFVIGLCGWVAPTAMELSWWPLFRDCTYYCCGLSLLAYCASDGKIQLIEAVSLFAAYLVYITIMYYNSKLEAFANHLVGKKVAPDPEETGKPGEAWAVPSPKGVPADVSDDAQAKKLGSVEDGTAAGDPEQTPEATPEGGGIRELAAQGDSKASLEDVDAKNKPEEKKDGAANEEEEDGDDDAPFIERPEGLANQVMWAVSLPVYVPLWFLTPQPSNDRACRGALPIPVFLCTFVISLLWISLFAFLLVWWVEILGEILQVNEIVMGFTILAAGTSIPDAVSSMAVAKKGHGDMAVSSSIGSNIFDILVGLPIPWIIKIGFIEGINFELLFLSPFLAFYVVLLLGMVLCTVVSIHLMGWKLNKPLGLAMAALYVIFLSIAMVVEAEEPDDLMVKH